MRVRYSSNNSGGSWWLKDADWRKLEKAGWEVEWGGLYFCGDDYGIHRRPDGKPEPCSVNSDCGGHRRYDSYKEAKAAGDDGRWLGALATAASKSLPSLAEAVREWESVTGQDASDEGCNCCGAPHSFSTDTNEYASGEDVIGLLYENPPRSLREAAERLKEKAK